MPVLDRLEESWRGRLAATAKDAQSRARRQGHDLDYQRDEMIDAVEALLFDSEEWAAIAATDISDLAHEIVEDVLKAQRAWAADRAMVADMERDGLL